jgi:uncharacterized protein HemY
MTLAANGSVEMNSAAQRKAVMFIVLEGFFNIVQSLTRVRYVIKRWEETATERRCDKTRQQGLLSAALPSAACRWHQAGLRACKLQSSADDYQASSPSHQKLR